MQIYVTLDFDILIYTAHIIRAIVRPKNKYAKS